jgi:hypothetical protein
MYIVHLLLDSNNNSNISTRANLEETIGNAIHARRVFIEISHSLTLAVKTFLLDQTEVMILHRGTHTHAHTRLISRFFRFKNETRQSYDNSTRVRLFDLAFSFALSREERTFSKQREQARESN